MKKLGIFVGERGLWTFFKEIHEDFANHYDTRVFTPKEYHLPLLSGPMNRWAFHSGIRSILKWSDACFFEWASELLAIASHMPKYTPVVARLHSFELADWVHKINWDHVDKIVFVSQAIRSKFVARYPKYTDRTVLVHNGVEVEKFRPVQRKFDFSLGMLCAINPIKRVYEAILTVKELRDLGYEATLHVAGGPMNGNPYSRYNVAVRRLVEKLDLHDSVKFYEQISNASAWLQNIDVFISNSYWEGLQTALLEAMASKCYCLAHYWDGAEEALPPDNIYITDNDLKQKLIAYSKLSDEEQGKRKDALGQIVRKKFNLNDKKAMLREVINGLL